MHRFWISLVVMMIVVLPIAGCGGSDDGEAKDAVALEASTTQAPTTEISVVQDPATGISTTLVPASTTSTSQAPPADDWTTIAMLQSTDSPWQGMEGILLSEPFTVSGKAQLVLDMPDAGQLDGVIVAIIPADKATDAIVRSWARSRTA